MDIQKYLLGRESPSFASYYNGKMSYALHGSAWRQHIERAFPTLGTLQTSENVFKTVIDLYAENLVPAPEQLRGFSNVLVPLLSRGEAPVLVDRTGEAHFPEHFEMISDGRYTVAAIFTRSLETMLDYVTFAYSDGRTELWGKDVPDDFSPADRNGYKRIETTAGNTLLRFALDDKGFGASLAALQDRLNHSILDQTVIAEMYARPFWYLLNVDLAPRNPYLPAGVKQDDKAMSEKETDGGGRIFTSSSSGPFGQLTPPTIGDMIAYHDSLIDKVSQNTGIPQFYFKPGQGAPPTGIALKVQSKRYNTKVARIRDDISVELKDLARLVGAPIDELWPPSDDLLQDALDAHGLNLSSMGYPLSYIAEVVTPGVDLDDYLDDGFNEAPVPSPDGATDMTAMGQTGLPATPGQVRAYAQNPGQVAR